MECFISMDPRGKSTMNAVLVLKKDLTHIKNQYRFLVDLKQKNDTYLSIDVNICEALSSSFAHAVTRLISEEIHRVSNFPYECPLKKVHKCRPVIDLILSGLFFTFRISGILLTISRSIQNLYPRLRLT